MAQTNQGIYRNMFLKTSRATHIPSSVANLFFNYQLSKLFCLLHFFLQIETQTKPLITLLLAITTNFGRLIFCTLVTDSKDMALPNNAADVTGYFAYTAGSSDEGGVWFVYRDIPHLGQLLKLVQLNLCILIARYRRQVRPLQRYCVIAA